ncbi:MAG TPA: hypothetical protein VLV45_05480 [Gemmatimonadales bacterium]|nr:hypothetical protein [Gemmatimonadales bacterium]
MRFAGVVLALLVALTLPHHARAQQPSAPPGGAPPAGGQPAGAPPTSGPPTAPQPPPQPAHVKILFTFQGAPTTQTSDPAEATNVLNARNVMRAWTDSVDVYLDQIALGAQDKGWIKARAGEQANYSVMIVSLPIQGGVCGPLGITTYSIVVFEPGTGGQWRYVQNLIGYGTSAHQAAGAIFAAATQTINAARSRPN